MLGFRGPILIATSSSNSRTFNLNHYCPPCIWNQVFATVNQLETIDCPSNAPPIQACDLTKTTSCGAKLLTFQLCY